jgi:hypothetical protein
MKDEVMKAIEKNELYDYVANNYWNMSKEELKDILLEAIWVGCSNAPRDEDFNRELASNLSERWGD